MVFIVKNALYNIYFIHYNNMSFIIDIFENLLKYNDTNVFIILDINNDIWFKMKDILTILGYYNITKSKRLKGLDKKNLCKFKYHNKKIYLYY
jgi:hypothetical protein